jgi:Flp pilus assembly protein TadD
MSRPSYRLASRLGFVALSALLCGTALATPQEQASATLGASVEAGVREAQTLRSQKDYAGAVHVLSQLMMVAADDPRVVGEYGKVLVLQGRSNDALDFLRRAVQLQPGDWTLYSALGVAFDQKSDYANAKLAYERALQIRPGESAVLNNYAMSRLQAGDPAEAKRLIALASASSRDERVMRNLAMINTLRAPAVLPAAAAAPAVASHRRPDASAAPHPLARTLTPAEGQTVVMQAVPVDPQAGPVRQSRQRRNGAHRSQATTTAAQTVPALRLSGDHQ